MVAVMGVGLASVGNVWQTTAKREKEEELLFIGDEFRRAIASFYSQTPAGQVPRYPRSLDELVQDSRFPTPVHHLRRIYRDPITGSTDWGLVKTPDGGIQGVHSLSPAMPLKTSGFRDIDEDFAGKPRYDEWVFTPLGSLTGASPGPSRPGPPRGTSEGAAKP